MNKGVQRARKGIFNLKRSSNEFPYMIPLPQQFRRALSAARIMAFLWKRNNLTSSQASELEVIRSPPIF
ncbi:MAG: hypothetical protein CL912_31435 [Deltaproteobacteria bacterium]|nr:hypothetical protein [Deltaproteobacteria bacterium]